MLCSVVVAIADRHAPIVFSNSGCKDSLKSNERGPQCLGEGGEQTCKQTGTPRWALLHTGETRRRPAVGPARVEEKASSDRRGPRRAWPSHTPSLHALEEAKPGTARGEGGAEHERLRGRSEEGSRMRGQLVEREPQASDDGEPFTPSGPRGTHETVPECEGPPGGRQGAGRARGQSECPADLQGMPGDAEPGTQPESREAGSTWGGGGQSHLTEQRVRAHRLQSPNRNSRTGEKVPKSAKWFWVCPQEHREPEL